MKCPECSIEVTGTNFKVRGKGEKFIVSFKCPGCGEKKKQTFTSDVWGNEEAIQLATLHPEIITDKPVGSPIQ